MIRKNIILDKIERRGFEPYDDNKVKNIIIENIDDFDFDDDDDCEEWFELIEILCKNNLLNSIKELVTHPKCDINMTLNGNTIASKKSISLYSNINILKICVEAGLNINHTNSKGEDILHNIIDSVKKTKFKEYINDIHNTLEYIVEKIDLADIYNTINQFDAFHYAVLNENEFVIRLLLQKGYEINRLTNDKNPNLSMSYGVKVPVSALQLACREKSAKMVELLLENGADVDLMCDNGRSPIFYLLSIDLEKHQYYNREKPRNNESILEIIKLLVQYGADINVIDFLGNNILLHLSSIRNLSKEYEALIYEILDCYIYLNINAVNNIGRNALHYAAKLGFYSVVKLLIGKGIEINKKDKNGSTPLIFMIEQIFDIPSEKVLKYLIKKGADVSAKNNENNTALSIASEKGYNSIVENLIGN